MKYQPTPAQKGNDDVQTPPYLAKQVVQHFKPRGNVLEPCEGDGNFTAALLKCVSHGLLYRQDIKNGPEEDFMTWDIPVDWIVTNPPWSKIRPFLAHSMRLADNVVFLITVNHVFTKARVRDVAKAGFGLKEILLVDTPEASSGWPQSGFQLGAVHWQRGYIGPVTVGDGK